MRAGGGQPGLAGRSAPSPLAAPTSLVVPSQHRGTALPVAVSCAVAAAHKLVEAQHRRGIHEGVDTGAGCPCGIVAATSVQPRMLCLAAGWAGRCRLQAAATVALCTRSGGIMQMQLGSPAVHTRGVPGHQRMGSSMRGWPQLHPQARDTPTCYKSLHRGYPWHAIWPGTTFPSGQQWQKLLKLPDRSVGAVWGDSSTRSSAFGRRGWPVLVRLPH